MSKLTPLFFGIWDRLPRWKIRGTMEYYLFPYFSDTWGGPFNGQCIRQTIFHDLLRECHFDAIAETGTYRGTTTSFMAFNAPDLVVHTSEADRLVYGYAVRRLRMHRNVRFTLADSREFLRNLSASRDARMFFYLDAHWDQDLPLAEEVGIIQERFTNYVIMIDDFEVPGDRDYTFDDYGPGKRLGLTDFPFHRDPRLTVYFPARPGSQESGRKRGAIVLASATMAGLVNTVPTLRRLAASSGTARAAAATLGA